MLKISSGAVQHFNFDNNWSLCVEGTKIIKATICICYIESIKIVLSMSLQKFISTVYVLL